MASNVIQQNRQRYLHRNNSIHLKKVERTRQCSKQQLKLKSFLSQQQEKSKNVLQNQKRDQQNHFSGEQSEEDDEPQAGLSGPDPSTITGKIKGLNIIKSLKLNPVKALNSNSTWLFFGFFLLLTCGRIVSGEGNIGCNFMRTLCIQGREVCFDDDIFGKCIPTTGVDLEDIDRTPLTEDQSEKLATILLELQGAGLGWDHPYVQCRIQGQLFSMQRHTQLPPNLCANLAPIPTEPDRNGDLAYVRFIPPLEDYVDAQDDSKHNLLYFPPMKKQASVDTIFHELQQELQPQRQQYQPGNPWDRMPYGRFDDRSYRQGSHSQNFVANPFMENERAQALQDRDFSPSELDFARKNLLRIMSEYNMDQDNGRNFEQESPPLSGFYGSDSYNSANQPSGYFNPFMDSGKINFDDERNVNPYDLYMPRGRFNRVLPDSYPNDQNKRHEFLDTITGNTRRHLNEDDGNFPNDFAPRKQKLYQTLNDFDEPSANNHYLNSFKNPVADEEASLENGPALFDAVGLKPQYEPQYGNDYESFRRMENQEPPKEEENHRSFFRELATEQGIEQAPLLPHEAQKSSSENDNDNNNGKNDDDDDDDNREKELSSRNKEKPDVMDQYSLGNSLVRNSLKPFEEDAILSSNPFPHKAKHFKVDRVFTEGGLVLVPQDNFQNDAAAFSAYDEMDPATAEKEKNREFWNDMFSFTRHERLDVKKPGPLIGPVDPIDGAKNPKNNSKHSETKEVLPVHIKDTNEVNKKKKVIKEDLSGEDSSQEIEIDYAYIYLKNPVKDREDAERIMIVLSEILHMQGFFDNLTIQDNGVSFRVNSNNPEHRTAFDIAKYINDNKGVKNNVLRRLGFTVRGAGIGSRYKPNGNDSGVSAVAEYAPADSELAILLIALISCLLVAVLSLFVLVYHRRKVREKLNLLTKGGVVTGVESCSKDYQDLCRARMAGKGNTTEPAAGGRIMSLSKENERPPSSRSSTSSWCEEPALTNMDISTGHMVLSYMEDHLRNKGRLQREWEALCRYEAEPSARDAAQQAQCANFNRSGAPLPYDHSRVVLNHLANAEGLDYINASSITDHDPRAPAYVAAQGPLPTTLAHFWQMIWEQGAVVIVSLCRLQENGEIACARYWPEEGAEVYHIYEVNLVSEHIWCDDYLVRSFYLKNLRTSETRTVTQFHFLSWPSNGVPAQAKALLDFRRKVNKSYRGRSCPIVVHGSTGAGRTGAYILLDLVLGRMNKGAREIDIAATLEHLRDQRAGLVATRQQFEFVLMAVAEEVHAILKALPANQSNEKKEIEGGKETNGTNGVNGSGNGGGSLSSSGSSSVAGGVLKEEESENNEEEAKAAAGPKENEAKAKENKSATPAKSSGSSSTSMAPAVPPPSSAPAVPPKKK